MNDQPREPPPPEDVDDFYRRASALDPSRPGDHVRRTALAHAAELASLRTRARPKRRRWQPALFGTLAAAVLAGLVIAPHWLRLRSPAAGAPPLPVAAPSTPAPATPAPPAAALAAEAPPAPAPATPVPATSPAATSGARITAPPSRHSLSDSSSAAADANVAGARAAAAPATPGAAIAPRETLQQAADTGDAETLRRLIGANADVDARDAQGRTALMHAVLHGQTQAAELLLSAGASPVAADNEGRTPLQAAEARGERAIVEVLERYGAR